MRQHTREAEEEEEMGRGARGGGVVVAMLGDAAPRPSSRLASRRPHPTNPGLLCVYQKMDNQHNYKAQ